MEFIDREKELKILEREWKRKPSFVVLYGRRRVGKTRLIREFSKEKKVFFFTFPEAIKEAQMREFKKELSRFFDDELILKLETDSWYDLFKYLASKLEAETLMVFDEFTYAIKSDRKILSDLQRVWDHELSRKSVMLILSGSLLGMMWDDVLSYASPLYGRRTRSMHLKPMDYLNSLRFFGDPEYGIQAYMLVGGIPHYLKIAREYSSAEKFLYEEFLSDYGFFYDEPYVILGEELRELRTYFSILRAIAEGNTRLEEIANFLGLPARSVYPYLENLLRLGLVKREKPLFGDRKVSLYRISDPMLLTWFTLVYPQMDRISLGTATLENIYKVFSVRFEDLAREFLILKKPFEFSQIGRWWWRGKEIDIVAINEDTAYLIEVKWKDLSKKDTRRILSLLKEKAKDVRFKGEFKHGIIARSIEGKEQFELAFDLEDILE
ncbi:ATP-binding protein [Thermococcus sp. SY098]|uniref:ATP-binding protein n=1 Tax=Thermococcus sp. SY098 TaxID=3111325 RepID=UPI002D771A35|nr:ATP-binding protein [Thermococcus sp. SY098]WRS52195.1 ATP-binding protein [Thermococcus sp. SY098]